MLLLSRTQVEEDDDFHELVNPKTKFETPAVGDVNMASLKKGDIIQLERRGYYIVDQPYGGAADKPAVLFSIPDGRTKNLGLGAEQTQ
jgi:glutamyl-tRNA synthetase